MTKIHGNLYQKDEYHSHEIKTKNEHPSKSSVRKAVSETLGTTSGSHRETEKNISRKDIQKSHLDHPLSKEKSEKMVINVKNKQQSIKSKFGFNNKYTLDELQIRLGEKIKIFNKKSTPIEEIHILSQGINALKKEISELSEKLSKVTDKGLKYYEAKNYSKAVEYFKFASENGDPFAMAMLGKCYFDGTGVKQDFKLAVKWFDNSAGNWNVEGLNALGACLDAGIGVKQNYKMAMACFEASAKQNDPDALFFLGMYHFEGKGCKVDMAKAAKYFEMSTRAENSHLQFADPENKRTENLGNGETALALSYLTGEGVEQDFDKALEHLTSAAKKGNESAQFYLGYCFVDGSVDKDKIEDVKIARHQVS